MAEKHRTEKPRHGEPVAPTAGEIDREMDPTKRRKPSPEPEAPGAPDMGAGAPHPEHGGHNPNGSAPPH